MFVGLCFAVAENLLQKPGRALLAKSYRLKLVPWGTLLHCNMAQWSMSLGAVPYRVTSGFSNAHLYINNSVKFLVSNFPGLFLFAMENSSGQGVRDAAMGLFY